MGQSDFCPQKEFILESLPQLQCLCVSHIRADDTLSRTLLLGESHPHHLPPKLQTNHHSFIRRSPFLFRLELSQGPQIWAARITDPTAFFSASHTLPLSGWPQPGCWVQVDPKSQNHSLSFISKDSLLVTQELILSTLKTSVGFKSLSLVCFPTSQGEDPFRESKDIPRENH